jgi:hypothetical protein
MFKPSSDIGLKQDLKPKQQFIWASLLWFHDYTCMLLGLGHKWNKQKNLCTISNGKVVIASRSLWIGQFKSKINKCNISILKGGVKGIITTKN